MELYGHAVLISALVVVFSRAQSGVAADKLCDAQMWYLDLLTEGPLSGPVLSDHQRTVHDKIKALMGRLKSQGHGYQVACSRLRAFEDILIDSEPHESSSGNPKKDSEENSPQKSKHEKDSGEETKISYPSKRSADKSDKASDENIEETASEDSGESEGFEYDFLLRGREDEAPSGKSDQKKADEKEREKASETDEKEREKASETDEKEREKASETDAKEREKAAKKDKASSDVEASPPGQRPDEAEAADPTEVDETDLSEEDISEHEENEGAEPTTNSDLADTDAAIDSAANTTQENSTDADGALHENRTGSRVQYGWLLQGVSLKNQSHATAVFRLKRRQTITVKLCHLWMKNCTGKTRSKCLCYYMQTLLFVCDTFDAPLPEILSETRSTSLAADVRQACNITTACSRLCFYAFETLQCLPAYETTLENKSVQTTPSPNEAAVKEKETENKETQETDSLNIPSDSDTKLEDKHTDDHDSKDEKSEPRTEDGNVHESDKKERTKETVQVGSKGENDAPNDSGQKDTTPTDSGAEEVPGQARQQVYSSEEIQLTLNKERAELEKLFLAQATEYAGKVQSLELLVTKLENQVLQERLTKQNDSVTVSRLESQILRLENQLLKLSHGYAQLHEEHERAKRLKRADFLGLDHVTQTSTNSLATYNASLQREHQQLLTAQQARLQELKDLLRNHTDQVDKLQSRTTVLEEQNQMLMQTVLNQSALIASILGQLQQLSEDNARRRQETSSLQSQVALQQGSDRLFARLESLVASVVQGRSESLDQALSGRGEVADGADQTAAERDGRSSSMGQMLADFLPKVPGANIPAWHCRGNNSTRVCFAYSVILTPCPPFSPVHWNSCPYYVADLSTEGLKRRSVAKQVGPLQVDASPNKIDKKEGSGGEEEKSTGSKMKEDDNEKEDNSKNENDDDKDSTSEHPETHPKLVDGKSGSDERFSDETKSEEDGDKKEENDNNQEGKTKEDDKKIQEKDKEESDVNKNKNDNTAAGGKDTEDTQKDAKEEQESTKVDKEGSPSSQATDNERPRKSESDEDKRSHDDIPRKPDTESEGSDEKEKDGNDADKESSAAPSTSKEDKANEEKKDTKSTSPKKEKKTQSPKKDSKGKGSVKTDNPKERELLYTSSTHREPKDCWDHYQRGGRHNGVYKVRLVTGQRLNVLCDMRAGGWTVVLKRQDGSLDFYRPWQDYKEGFGEVLGEHYVGNDNLHRLTNQDRYSLAVDLWDWSYQRQKAFYQHFWVDDEDAAYRLHVYEHSGNAPDALLKHNLMKFSTYDRDNDLVTKEFKDFDNSCARRFHGAGWYYKCYMSNVFGVYYAGGDIPPKKFDGVTWKPWTGPNYSLKEVVFKIRPAAAAEV